MYRRRTRTSDERRWRSINVARYFAEDEKHTLADAKRDLSISKTTVERDLEHLRTLIVFGEFKNNPELDREMRITYSKAIKRLKDNKINPENAAKATAVNLERSERKKSLS